MAEVNLRCVPIYVYQEDVNENAVSAQRKRDSLRELSRAPVIAYLLGTMASLSEMTSNLPVLHPRPPQISSEKADVQPVSTADGRVVTEDRREMSPGIRWSDFNGTVASEKRLVDLPKMVELYQYPQLGNAPVSLPHHTPYSTIVKRVVQSQRHLLPKPSTKAEFQNILSSPTVECFVISSFWWLFLHNFQPDRKTQDLLFHRIAENYIRILTANLSSQGARVFLQAFPATLSQMLYCCFCTCFPQSRSLREHAFLTALCSTAYQWTGGIRPAPEVYRDWDLETLEVEETARVSGQGGGEEDGGSSLSVLDSVLSGASLSKSSIHSEHSSKKSKHVGEMSQTSVLCSSRKKAHSEDITGSDLKALTNPANHRSDRQAHVADVRMELKRSVFNVWGNSPLVQYAMAPRGLGHPAGHPVLMQWTEMHRQTLSLHTYPVQNKEERKTFAI